jgi:predicted house-cleaning noncanonical NTP pyrophosphatase (MazG superfamily)
MTPYRKLVRDNIPAHLDAKGIPYEKHVADDAEYRLELIRKLHEEAVEFSEAGAIEELADVMEVIDALRALPEYAQVTVVQEAKRAEKGAFTNRYIVSGEK